MRTGDNDADYTRLTMPLSPRLAVLLLTSGLAAATVSAQRPPRARDLGVPFEGTPGRENAITDVAGVTVGHSTIIRGDGALKVGEGPVRTGVTAVMPRGRDSMQQPSFAGWFSQNGNGEMTGTTWIEESGFLEGPVMITNTHSVGTVRDAVIKWRIRSGPPDASGYWWSLPVVAETYDGVLNDINGFHVKDEHAFAALDGAKGGAVPEGNVGGGTGMVAYGFKGGIGTSSRVVARDHGGYTVGVLVNANHGTREQLTIAGVPVGRELRGYPAERTRSASSIVMIAATDAPLSARQLERLALRMAMGLARTGATANTSSGDLMLAFSTAKFGSAPLDDERVSPLYQAAVEATEESVLNALALGTDVVGVDGTVCPALPLDRVVALLKARGVIQ